jgi:hypothetical protein
MAPPPDPDRVMWIAIRRALLAAATAIGERYDLGDETPAAA